MRLLGLPPDMLQSAEWALVWAIDAAYRALRLLVHWLLAAAFWSRGRPAPPLRDPLLKMAATELAEQIREGNLSSELVVRTFIERIHEVEPLVNATAECRFADALREARDVDALVASLDAEGRRRTAEDKPLLGVPFSVKVLLTVKGMRSTAGCVLFKEVRAQEDAPTVHRLRQAGGIVLCTTNTAELGMNFESSNFVHGTTCNPYDSARTSGGSSGGESALIAAAGSVIGLGNDMAGSIRVPCMFSGIFGHKPSLGLVSNEGSFPKPLGVAVKLVYTGPMCRYAKDLQTMMKVLVGEKQTRIGHDVNFQKVKVYYMNSFGHIPLVENVDPEIQEAVQKVVSYFKRKHGCPAKEAQVPLLRHANGIMMHALGSTTPPNLLEALTKGKTTADPSLELLKMVFRRSKFTVGPLVASASFSMPLLYNPRLVALYSKMEEELKKDFDHLLDDDHSVLILPTLPFPAPYHREISLMTSSSVYTHVFNLLGNPVTQCPVGFTKGGLPIGVQVVGRLGNDALTLACAVELEKAFGGWVPPK